jgi:hypothetical protein
MAPTNAPTSAAARGLVPLAWLLAAWLGLIAWLTLAGAFVTPPGPPPWPIIVAVNVPILAFAALYLGNAAFRGFVLGFDLRILVLLHAWRTVGVGFVFLYFHDKLPGIFALPAGLGDALAAFGAVALGIALYRGPVAKGWVAAWNGYGLADFIVALGTGIAASEPALAALTGGVSMAPMQLFPLTLIPAFFVPLYIITHIIIFLQLRRHWGGSAVVDLGR